MELKIQTIVISKLQPYNNNARTHSEQQVQQIANSIKQFGFVNPLLIGADHEVIAGHGRLLAAKHLGLKTVPVIYLKHLDAVQRRALILADNQLAANAGWDEDMLRQELEALSALDFNLDVIGFSDAELDQLLSADCNLEGAENEEQVPALMGKPISKLGDLWLLGKHKLLCGDATNKEDVQRLLDNKKVDLVFTDPPYNVNYGKTAKDKLRVSQGKSGGRLMMNDNLGKDFKMFLTKACVNLLEATTGAIYICMSSSEIDTLKSAFTEAGGKWSTFIIWAKNTFTLGRSDYQRQYEPILYGWKDGGDRHWCGARDQGDVWFYAKASKNDLHPTMKPVELVARALKNSSQREDVVLDTFAGSGSTLIAAERTNRLARLIELDPCYVDVIIKRWQDFTGDEAILASTGETYTSLAAT